QRARTYLESWISGKPPEPSQAYRQWMELYQTTEARLPNAVLEAFLRRFPKPPRGRIDWAPFILSSTETHLPEVLVTRSLLSSPDLIRIAKANPLAFYRSAALDVLVERRLQCPRSVWDAFVASEIRPVGLMKPSHALVRSFAVDRKKDAPKWLLNFLANATS